ncbi:hypothetical protein PDIDSM_6917 [Penicillium digitatum]|nr:hypothetical protein PDIDSM_6917 [Penicillium digitatum]
MATQTIQPQLGSLQPYVHPPETEEPLQYADLTIIDLGEFDKPGGKEKLAAQLKDAAHNEGFFYVTNFGLTQAEINRQYAIGREFFALPEDVRKSYAPSRRGDLQWLRPLGSIQFLPQYERAPRSIPSALDEIERFHRHVHEHVGYKLLQLLAIILELPADQSKRSPRPPLHDVPRPFGRGERAVQGSLFRGHTDNGTITFLFQQPVAALQVKKHEDSLGSGFGFRSGVHRVTVPPKDQQRRTPLLRRLGYYEEGKNSEIDIPAPEWTRARIKKNWSRSPTDPNAGTQMAGFSVKHFHD